MLDEFAKQHDLGELPEDKQFEHLAAFSMLSRHYSRAFKTQDVVLGGGGDIGTDAIAIIVNNNLITDVDQVHDLADQNGYIDATYIFVQSERTPNFSSQKIG